MADLSLSDYFTEEELANYAAIEGANYQSSISNMNLHRPGSFSDASPFGNILDELVPDWLQEAGKLSGEEMPQHASEVAESLQEQAPAFVMVEESSCEKDPLAVAVESLGLSTLPSQTDEHSLQKAFPPVDNLPEFEAWDEDMTYYKLAAEKYLTVKEPELAEVPVETHAEALSPVDEENMNLVRLTAQKCMVILESELAGDQVETLPEASPSVEDNCTNYFKLAAERCMTLIDSKSQEEVFFSLQESLSSDKKTCSSEVHLPKEVAKDADMGTVPQVIDKEACLSHVHSPVDVSKDADMGRELVTEDAVPRYVNMAEVPESTNTATSHALEKTVPQDIDPAGIQAADMNSLLMQFEEVSQSYSRDDSEIRQFTGRTSSIQAKSQSQPASRACSAASSPVVTPPVTPPPELLDRIRSRTESRKRKTTTMIPLAGPAKRSYTKERTSPLTKATGGSFRLQKILSRNSLLPSTSESTLVEKPMASTESQSQCVQTKDSHPQVIPKTVHLPSADEIKMQKKKQSQPLETRTDNPPRIKSRQTVSLLSGQRKDQSALVKSKPFISAVSNTPQRLAQSEDNNIGISENSIADSVIPAQNTVSSFEPSTIKCTTGPFQQVSVQACVTPVAKNVPKQQSAVSLLSSCIQTSSSQPQHVPTQTSSSQPRILSTQESALSGVLMSALSYQPPPESSSRDLDFSGKDVVFIRDEKSLPKGVERESLLDHDYVLICPRRVVIDGVDLDASSNKSRTQKPSDGTHSLPDIGVDHASTSQVSDRNIGNGSVIEASGAAKLVSTPLGTNKPATHNMTQEISKTTVTSLAALKQTQTSPVTLQVNQPLNSSNSFKVIQLQATSVTCKVNRPQSTYVNSMVNQPTSVASKLCRPRSILVGPMVNQPTSIVSKVKRPESMLSGPMVDQSTSIVSKVKRPQSVFSGPMVNQPTSIVSKVKRPQSGPMVNQPTSFVSEFDKPQSIFVSPMVKHPNSIESKLNRPHSVLVCSTMNQPTSVASKVNRPQTIPVSSTVNQPTYIVSKVNQSQNNSVGSEVNLPQRTSVASKLNHPQDKSAFSAFCKVNQPQNIYADVKMNPPVSTVVASEATLQSTRVTPSQAHSESLVMLAKNINALVEKVQKAQPSGNMPVARNNGSPALLVSLTDADMQQASPKQISAAPVTLQTTPALVPGNSLDKDVPQEPTQGKVMCVQMVKSVEHKNENLQQRDHRGVRIPVEKRPQISHSPAATSTAVQNSVPASSRTSSISCGTSSKQNKEVASSEQLISIKDSQVKIGLAEKNSRPVDNKQVDTMQNSTLKMGIASSICGNNVTVSSVHENREQLPIIPQIGTNGSGHAKRETDACGSQNRTSSEQTSVYSDALYSRPFFDVAELPSTDLSKRAVSPGTPEARSTVASNLIVEKLNASLIPENVSPRTCRDSSSIDCVPETVLPNKEGTPSSTSSHVTHPEEEVDTSPCDTTVYWSSSVDDGKNSIDMWEEMKAAELSRLTPFSRTLIDSVRTSPQADRMQCRRVKNRSAVSRSRQPRSSPQRGTDRRQRNGWSQGAENEGFSKLPSYINFGDISVPKKTGRKELRAEDIEGMSVHDFFPLDQSALEKENKSGISKLPGYFQCFTNSTKFDEMKKSVKDVSVVGELERSEEEICGTGHPNISKSSSSRRSSNRSDKSRRKSRSRSRVTKRSRSGRRKPMDSSGSSRSRSRSRSLKHHQRSSSVSGSSHSSYRSRSQSRSRASSRSLTNTSRSRSRSRSRSNPRTYRRSRYDSRRHKSRYNGFDMRDYDYDFAVYENRQRKRDEKAKEKIEKMRQRKVVYVGGIPNRYTRRELYECFECYGKIEDVSVHFREDQDNYGFVTFYNHQDAHNAIEKGSKDPAMRFKLSYGGRRVFCANEYADLDGNLVIKEEYNPMPVKKVVDFDELLRQAKRSQKKK